MDPDSVAFWGIALSPGEPTELELREGESLHVSMASLGPKLKDSTGRSVVTVQTEELEKSFAVCALNPGKTESTLLDITFEGDEKVTFKVTGKNEVHLVGNFSFDEDAVSSDEEEGLVDVYNGEPEMGDVEDSEEENEEGSTLMIDDPPVITEVEEKPKVANGHMKSGKGKVVRKGKGTQQPDKVKSAVGKKGTPKKPANKKVESKEVEVKKGKAEKPSEKVVEKTESKPLSAGKRKMNDSKNSTPVKKPKANTKDVKAIEKNAGDVDMKTPEKQQSTPNSSANGSTGKRKRKRSKRKITPTRS